ncbi:hypothetical protein [Methylomonas koyamae]|uniref:hypothetical protein n=1 Tax=Methylomonas koyamae TaxID=702114 RepID=UPI000A63AA51|nr:hypothetical protein [Methylomonas koyamae]
MKQKTLPPAPPPCSKGGPTAETLAMVNSARQSFGLAPYSEKDPFAPFSWPIDAVPVFTRAALNLNTVFISDCRGFRTPEETAPAHMTVMLVGSLLDGFALLAKADGLQSAWHQLSILERVLQCATETFEIVKSHPDASAEEKSWFMRRTGFRIDLAGELLSQLREFAR